jgi:steroid delta-isomerase-like uncharacterized protein
MAQENLVQKVKEHIAAYCAKDWNRYTSMLSDDCTYEEEATHQKVQGKQKIVDLVKKWTVAFPDVKATVKETFVAGDKVVAEILWEGTNTGPLNGVRGSIPATGKRGSVPAVEVITFDNGKISEMRHYFDLMTVFEQLGLAPKMGTAQPQP